MTALSHAETNVNAACPCVGVVAFQVARTDGFAALPDLARFENPAGLLGGRRGQLNGHAPGSRLEDLVAGVRGAISTPNDDRLTRAQIAFLYWATDFPSPSNSFANLSCRSFVPANGAANTNPGAYCNPQIDKLANQALATQTSDPTTARQLWAQVDRMVTDDAAIVPTVNGKIENLVSTGLGNFQNNPQLGPLFDQMWVH